MKHFTYLLCLLLLLAACKKGDLKAPDNGKSCADTLQHDIISVSGPTTVATNQQVTFNVTWKGYNSCDNFISFKQDTTLNTIAIKAFSSQDSCSTCNLKTGTYKSAPYKFVATKPGTYYLKFFRSANAPVAAITDTLIVKE